MLDHNVLEQRTDSRSSVVKRAMLLTPTAIALVAILVYAIQFLPNSFIAVFVLTLGGIPAAIEAFAAIRDLNATPTTTRGRVRRLWKKSRYLFVGRVDYMLVEKRLFEVNALTATELHEGDEVLVVHWPNTNVLISLTRVPSETPRQSAAPRRALDFPPPSTQL